jgi:hypothetical protein
VTWGRDEPLVKKGWVTPQQGEVDLQNLNSQEAAVAAAQDNVTAQESLLKQLRQNRQYASVIAPFDGVITQRNVDVGNLVQGNTTSGTFMFEIMQEDGIRVWVYVPQDAAFGMTPGVHAIVRVPELPDREFPGTVTRIAPKCSPGGRPLLLIGFAALPIRALVFAWTTSPMVLIAAQILDWVSGTMLGVLTALVVADLTRGTGRFSLAQGFVGTMSGIGASFSTTLTGLVAGSFGRAAGFLSIAAVALVALLLLWLQRAIAESW